MNLSIVQIGIGIVALLIFAVILFGIGVQSASGPSKKLMKAFRGTFLSRERIKGEINQELNAKIAHFDAEHQKIADAFEKGLAVTGSAAGSQRMQAPEQVDQKAARILQRLENWYQTRGDRIRSAGETQLGKLQESATASLSAIATGGGEAADFTAQRTELLQEWQTQAPLALQDLQSEQVSFDLANHWSNTAPETWTPPAQFTDHLVLGQVNYDFHQSGEKLSDAGTMSWDHDGKFQLPLRLNFPDTGSLLFETQGPKGREDAIATLNQLVVSLLASAPAGRLSFSLFDPVGLGESFAGLMDLADYEEHLINTKIRTQGEQMERRLGELCEHMEKVIQMYLRNEYETISEYNEKAGTIAERYHFLVVADFPNQFSDEAARRLMSIAQSGARCGVFMLLHYDKRIPLPTEFRLDDLRNACVSLRSSGEGITIGDEELPSGAELNLIPLPTTEHTQAWVHRIGEANRDSNRVEVPFHHIAPGDSELWSRETTSELRVPIGRTGATKLQELAIGKGTCQHALIAGKTGSGKSTLFHIMITNMALWFDPDKVEFYLIDFKKGVEFKAYADQKLPHARVIAIESDREFGLSVLSRLDEELKSRGEKFRSLGAQDVAGYKKAGGTDPIPRTLLLIDEFQEFFVEDDQISQQAAVLLDR
ncbi:MAG: FtsK/SpoIIIE domain-containing protein, partial [Verrucomicrobiota bacterium]